MGIRSCMAVNIETGEEYRSAAPLYGMPIMLCYSCLKQAIRIDKNKLLREVM